MSYDEKVADLQERQRTLTGALVLVRSRRLRPAGSRGRRRIGAIAMACDIRIAAQSAFISTGYLRGRLERRLWIAWLLTRLVGTSRARELMFTGTRSMRRDARRSACSTRGSGRQIAERGVRARQIDGEGPTLALRYMKDNLDEALLFDFATARTTKPSAGPPDDDRRPSRGGAGLIEKRQRCSRELNSGSASARAFRPDHLWRLSEGAQGKRGACGHDRQ